MKRSGVGVLVGTLFAACLCLQDTSGAQTVLSYHGTQIETATLLCLAKLG
jgi:hypothetical protein